jgi:hypothetical protein
MFTVTHLNEKFMKHATLGIEATIDRVHANPTDYTSLIALAMSKRIRQMLKK